MFRIQHVDTKKRKKGDVPRFEGECLNKPEILERLKGAESKNAAKQAKKQHKLSFNDEQQINQATTATPTTITAANQLKCKKCRKVLGEASSSQYMEWYQCENSKCKVWVCQTCIPKRYVKGAEFYCTKKCRKSDNSTQPLVLLNNSTSSQE